MESQRDPINEYKNKLEEERKVKERIKQDYEHKLREEGKKKNNNLQKQNDRLKKEKDDIQKQYNSLLKENDQLKKDKKDIQSQFKEKEKIISKQNKTIENLNKEKNSMIEEFSKIKNENEILTNENQELKTKISNLSNAINVLSTKEEFLEKSEEQFYDVIIDINSINALLSKGWNIKYNQERKEIYEKIIQEETIKIGVLGLNNVGKSFILSSITKDTIPTGYSIETKGISIKYTEEEKGICLLDSAGFETPLLKNDFIIPSVINNNFNVNNNINNNNSINNNINNSINDSINNSIDGLGKIDFYQEERKDDNKIKNITMEQLDLIELENELAKDKTQTEKFIERLIISLSDLLILVIGKLTRTEQKLINRIKNIVNNKDNCQIKTIIIIHNLSQYHKIIEVENHIKNNLKQSGTFTLIEKQVRGIQNYTDRIYYIEEKKNEKEIEVLHYLMAKEGTEAGNYYNNLTLELIKNQYNFCNNRKAIDIPKKIVELFSELSNEIIEEKININQLEISNDNKTIKIKEGIFPKDKNHTLIMQETYIDENGDYKNNKFNPRYSLYRYVDKIDDEIQNFLLLRLEIPGKIDKLFAEFHKKEKYRGILVKGIKSRDDFPEENKDKLSLIKENRVYDEFEYFIQLNNKIELIKNFADGNTEIYTFDFDKRNKDKKILNNDDNNYIENIASGIYILKFKVSDSSF